jgi:hypothetical protein
MIKTGAILAAAQVLLSKVLLAAAMISFGCGSVMASKPR